MVLVEQITQPELHGVGGGDAHVVAEGAGDHVSDSGCQFESGHHSTTRNQGVLVLWDQDGTGVDGLQFTPTWVQHVAEVEDIHGELQGVLGLTHFGKNVLSEFQVYAVQPGQLSTITLSILSAVCTQVFVLLNIGLKQIALRSLIVGNPVLGMAYELHLLQFSYRRDVDQVVAVHPIAVEVSVVGVGETSVDASIVEQGDGGSQVLDIFFAISQYAYNPVRDHIVGIGQVLVVRTSDGSGSLPSGEGLVATTVKQVAGHRFGIGN